MARYAAYNFLHAGSASFAFFAYNTLEFTSTNAVLNGEVQAGFDSGDGTHYYELPGSFTANVSSLISKSNINVTGLFGYKTSASRIIDPAASPDPTPSITASASAAATTSRTASPNSSVSVSATATLTTTPSVSRTASVSTSATGSLTSTPTESRTASITASWTASRTHTPSVSSTATVSSSTSQSATPSATTLPNVEVEASVSYPDTVAPSQYHQVDLFRMILALKCDFARIGQVKAGATVVKRIVMFAADGSNNTLYPTEGNAIDVANETDCAALAEGQWTPALNNARRLHLFASAAEDATTRQLTSSVSAVSRLFTVLFGLYVTPNSAAVANSHTGQNAVQVVAQAVAAALAASGAESASLFPASTVFWTAASNVTTWNGLSMFTVDSIASFNAISGVLAPPGSSQLKLLSLLSLLLVAVVLVAFVVVYRAKRQGREATADLGGIPVTALPFGSSDGSAASPGAGSSGEQLQLAHVQVNIRNSSSKRGPAIGVV